MTKELVSYDPNEELLPDLVNPYEDQFDQIAGSGGFLPRLQLFIANSGPVKKDKIAMNHYGLVTGKDQIEDLGREVDVLMVTFRPRALDTSDTDNIRATSDINGDLFKEIQDKSDNEENSGAMYGPEFLLYVPKVGKFATTLFGSKSARNEAKNAIQYKGRHCTFKSKLIETKKYSWQAMLITACSTPFEIPTREVIMEVATEFLNPKELLGSEKVKEGEAPTRER
jgi:hypothetical protein